jgi:3-oxoacyl-[acyl-carrier protein] reductase
MPIKTEKKLLLFGASGTIGKAIQSTYKKQNWKTICVTRESTNQEKNSIVWNPVSQNIDSTTQKYLTKQGPFDAVCWSQGMNLNDDIYSYKQDDHLEMYQANVVYILNSLNTLLTLKLINPKGKFCIISSIWQNISRQNKLSYAITKSALQGLVLSASNDLAKEGYLFNAVLPGAIDTPMTRSNLDSEQIIKIEQATQFNRLISLEDVANSVFSLCSDINTGVTGNFLTVDLGFSNVRNI